jgi:hypothetical protein
MVLVVFDRYSRFEAGKQGLRLIDDIVQVIDGLM